MNGERDGASDGGLDRLGAARHAIDRRRRRERRRQRRARRARSRVLWGLAYFAVLNAAAWICLDTPERLLTTAMMLRPDKLEHFLTFLLLTLVAIPLLSRWISAGMTVLGLINLGLVIEVAQAFDPTRNADVADFGFDQLGILVGWLAVTLVRRWRERGDAQIPGQPSG